MYYDQSRTQSERAFHGIMNADFTFRKKYVNVSKAIYSCIVLTAFARLFP